MLLKIKIILGITTNEKNSLIMLLIENCEEYIRDYCHILTVDSKFDSTIIKMVVESYNKIGSQGVKSESYSGVSVSYMDDFSPSVYKALNRYRRVQVI